MNSLEDKYGLEKIYDYCTTFSAAPNPVLDEIDRYTKENSRAYRMLSGSIQVQFLNFLIAISGARKLLEIGTFTGYSAIGMLLDNQAHLTSLDISDEHHDFIHEMAQKSGVSSRLDLQIADGLEYLTTTEKRFDFVFIDAAKKQYIEYFNALKPLLEPQAIIVADNVLWKGEVLNDSEVMDARTKVLHKFNQTVRDDPEFENILVPLRDGIQVMRKK